MKDRALETAGTIALSILVVGNLFMGYKVYENRSNRTEETEITITQSNLDKYKGMYEDMNVEKNLSKLDSEDYDYSQFDKIREAEKAKIVELDRRSEGDYIDDSIPTVTNNPTSTAEVLAQRVGVPYKPNQGSQAQVIEIASEYLGIPYLWGGTNPRVGLDCSGFTQLVMARMGHKVPRVSKDQSRVGTLVVGSKLEVGDLLFFDTMSSSGVNMTIRNVDLSNYTESESYRPMDVSHVGIYAGNGQMIHAASGDGKVTFSNLYENYYMKRFLHARRILPKEVQ